MSSPSDPQLLALHGLRLKGFATASAVARLYDQPEQQVEAHLERSAADGLAIHRQGRVTGWTLTPDGRARNERLLAEELEHHGIANIVRRAYQRFLALNGDMLATCTRWQVRDLSGEQVLNDHSDAGYDSAVLDELAKLDDGVQPICAELAEHLERFAIYAPRFTVALERIRSGELEWFTKPIIESYHTVWFELHEDLLATLGVDRASEGNHGT